MFSMMPDTLMRLPPRMRTTRSRRSRTSELTKTGLRSSILGTWRKVCWYSSNVALRCLPLMRFCGFDGDRASFVSSSSIQEVVAATFSVTTSKSEFSTSSKKELCFGHSLYHKWMIEAKPPPPVSFSPAVQETFSFLLFLP